MLAGRIVGAETVIAHFAVAGPAIHDRLKDRISRLAVTLLTHVKEDKLSGQVLHNVTGTLRRSINMKVDDQGSSITGSVGTNLVYARAHEFGVDQHKLVTVHEYMRSSVNAATQKWRLKHKFGLAQEFLVHEFTRNQHTKLPERSFLRAALNDLRPQIRLELEQVIRGAL
jgi:phage gpG-like protein